MTQIQKTNNVIITDIFYKKLIRKKYKISL